MQWRRSHFSMALLPAAREAASTLKPSPTSCARRNTPLSTADVVCKFQTGRPNDLRWLYPATMLPTTQRRPMVLSCNNASSTQQPPCFHPATIPPQFLQGRHHTQAQRRHPRTKRSAVCDPSPHPPCRSQASGSIPGRAWDARRCGVLCTGQAPRPAPRGSAKTPPDVGESGSTDCGEGMAMVRAEGGGVTPGQ